MPLLFVIAILLALAHPAPAQRSQRPEWVQKGLVMASNMEALSFVRRRGGQAANYAELWQKEQSEDAILALKVQGVNTVLISLMKGAGIKAEADDIDAARKYVELAHRHGMKVGGYVGASIFFETMFDEEPDSVNWIQRDEEGRPLHYNPTQTFRYMANRNHTGYHDYVKRILKLGIGDLKLDFVHFDQMMWWRLPYVSHTELDQQMFRDYVHAKYPPDRMKERFGFSQMKHLRLPEFGLNSPITWSEVLNPAVQEMVQFRSFTLAERFREYDEYIHQLNPQAALQANPHLDPSANNALMYGIDVPQLLAHGDIITSEERNEPQYTTDGRLISRIRTYLAGRIMGKPILFWQQPATIVGRPAHHTLQSPQKLRLAEALAYCNNCIGLTAGMDVGNLRFPQEAQNYIDFYWKRNELLANAESAAEIAVLRSFPSVELNASQVLPPLVLFEQSLIQAQIPFDTIFDRHLNSLSRYKVLVLANQDALSGQQLETIRTYVSAGGSIIATDQTSMFNDWRQRRPQLGLSKVFQFDHVPSETRRVQCGKGRAVFIPKVQPAMQPPPPQLYYVFRNEFWKLAKNHAEIVQAVRWALNGAPAVQVTAPDSLAVNFTEQKSQHRRVLHLVNYRVNTPALNVGIQFRVPAGKRLKQAVLETPDGGAPSKLMFTTTNDVATLTVPRVSVYSLLAFEMEDRR